MRERYRPLVERFELMQELALVLNRKRVRRGSIDFDLPEPLIEFDEFGAMTGVTRAPRNIAHRLIEEFMLAANESRGLAPGGGRDRLDLPHPRKARSQARPGVRGGRGAFRLLAGRRRHPRQEVPHTPTSTATAARSAAKSSCCRNPVSISSRHYQKLVAKIEGKPEERILSYLMLRSLQAGALQHRKCRPLRAGGGHLHAFHFADPPLSGPDRPPPAASVLTGRPTPRRGAT